MDTTDLEKALQDNDAAILVTKHREYQQLTHPLKATLRTPIIIDGRNLWNRQSTREGFTFREVGHPRK